MLYFIGSYYLYHNPPVFDVPLIWITPHSLFIFTLLLSVIMLYLLKRENLKSEETITDLYQSVNGKNKELKHAYEELEKYTYIASHDLKTPLRTISSFLGLIELKLKEKKYHEIPEFLDYAQTGAKEMHFLITDILEFSKIGREREPVKENINLRDLLISIKRQSKSLLDSKKGKILFGEMPNIYSSKMHFRLLLQNLIENGLKYNESSSPWVRVDAIQHNNNIKISVRDNGIGIPKEYHDKIFEMFSRLHPNSQYEGTGIGLAMAKRIVEIMDGQISLESSPGQGSTFYITIPVSRSIVKTQEPILADS